jgi:hypothetical protein
MVRGVTSNTSSRQADHGPRSERPYQINEAQPQKEYVNFFTAPGWCAAVSVRVQRDITTLPAPPPPVACRGVPPVIDCAPVVVPQEGHGLISLASVVMVVTGHALRSHPPPRSCPSYSALPQLRPGHGSTRYRFLRG